MAYSIKLASTARRDLAAIPPRYARAILGFVFGVLPKNPHRVGKPLGRELDSCHGARRGDYRVIYEIREDAGEVLVARISHRAHAYRSR
jgi:mRNA interferase RelE/StbE